MAVPSFPASISVKLIKLSNNMESLEKVMLEPPDVKVWLRDYQAFLLRHHASMKDEIALFVESVEELSRGIPTVFRPGMQGDMADVVQELEEGLKEAIGKFMLYPSQLEKCRRVEYRLEVVKETVDEISRDVQKVFWPVVPNQISSIFDQLDRLIEKLEKVIGKPPQTMSFLLDGFEVIKEEFAALRRNAKELPAIRARMEAHLVAFEKATKEVEYSLLFDPARVSQKDRKLVDRLCLFIEMVDEIFKELV